MTNKTSKQPDDVWVSIPISHLAVSRYKVALNIRELTALTNDFSKKYVQGCSPTLVKSLPKELSWQYRVVCQKADSDPAGHEVRIKLDISQVDKSTVLNDLQVRCSCTCPAFLYWGAQWHLHEKDSLEGQARPLLQAPQERLDLRDRYLICKHVKVVSDRIIPAVSRVLNNVTRKLKSEAIRQDEQRRIQEENEKRLMDEQKRLQDMEDFKKRPKPSTPAKPLNPNVNKNVIPKKPAPPKPDRGGTDMGLKPGQKVRTRKGVI